MSAPGTPEHVDVLVIGAGLSGIGAACQLSERLPGKSVAILESRDAIGGTWDLFRYPGVRSDSDMFTFAYPWRPWPSDTALADGPLIREYIQTVAEEYDVKRLIRFQHLVTRASWDSEAAHWVVTVETDDGPTTITTGFLWGCSGYYNYEHGYQPDFPGQERYAGRLIHPQHWPEDLDYAGKKVVVIGSGATAVTLVPAMALGSGAAQRVTMLQRSPTYIISMPGRDPLARLLGRLPRRLSFGVVRWKNVLMQIATYQLAQRRPETAKRLIRKFQAQALPDGYPIDEHFTPSYGPWDERLCLVPDGDLFRAIRKDRAEIVTDTIETFTETGLRTTSGRDIEADIIVSATGLEVLAFGGIEMDLDGEPVDAATTMSYKALMLSGVPNFAYTVGYSNASWTLKADLVAEYVCRLLAHMDEHGKRTVVAPHDPSVGELPFMPLQSGYIKRALDKMPKQGDRAPWLLKQNYLFDLRTIRRGAIEDGVLIFS